MVKVGILGAGGMGNVHARQYRKMQDVDLSFFEPDPQRAAEYSERWNTSVATSVEALIEASDIVDICLPTPLHVDIALKAVAAGKAIFVEKPLARNLEEGAKLIEAVNKAGVVAMPGQVVRFFPEFARGHDLVVKGTVGTPASARVRRGGAAPMGAGGWFMNHEASGGVLLDLAVHDFDWLRWTLGEVKHVYSRSVSQQNKQESGPDYALTTLTFDSGAVAHSEATWMDPAGFRTTFEVCGKGGVVHFDSRNNQALRTTAGGKTMFDNNLGPKDDPYYKQLRGFVDAVLGKGQVPVSLEDGWKAMAIALAAIESTKTGRVVAPARG